MLRREWVYFFHDTGGPARVWHQAEWFGGHTARGLQMPAIRAVRFTDQPPRPTCDRCLKMWRRLLGAETFVASRKVKIA